MGNWIIGIRTGTRSSFLVYGFMGSGFSRVLVGISDAVTPG